MGVIKANSYSPQAVSIASIGRALAHPCRVSIIDLLIINNRLSNQELAIHFNMNRSTIHEHLIKLWQGDLISIESLEGQCIASISDEQISKYQQLANLVRFHSKKSFHLAVLD